MEIKNSKDAQSIKSLAWLLLEVRPSQKGFLVFIGRLLPEFGRLVFAKYA